MRMRGNRRTVRAMNILPSFLIFFFFFFSSILFLKKASSSSACKHRCAGNHKLHLRSTLPRVLNMERVAGRCKLRAVWGDAVKLALYARKKYIPPTQIKTRGRCVSPTHLCTSVGDCHQAERHPSLRHDGSSIQIFQVPLPQPRHCFPLLSFSVIKILWFYQV